MLSTLCWFGNLASTEIFYEPEMNFVGKDFFSFSNRSPPIGPKFRYIHNVTFPVALGRYSYMVGNQDAVSEKLEFEVLDDQQLNILAVGDLGKSQIMWLLHSESTKALKVLFVWLVSVIQLKFFPRVGKCGDLWSAEDIYNHIWYKHGNAFGRSLL